MLDLERSKFFSRFIGDKVRDSLIGHTSHTSVKALKDKLLLAHSEGLGSMTKKRTIQLECMDISFGVEVTSLSEEPNAIIFQLAAIKNH